MIIAILQARVSSSRLPGKVLKSMQHRPMLAYQLERVLLCKKLDKLVVATSTSSEDDGIEALCEKMGVVCFRGSLKDVLDRYYHAALTYGAETVVRLTGDCPLSDPEVIDELIDFFLSANCDYASNTLEPTYPHGLDVEAFSFATLAAAYRESIRPSHREHVTKFIYDNKERFRIRQLKYKEDFSNIRITVDHQVDFDLIDKVIEHFQAEKIKTAGFRAIIDFLRSRPDLLAMNAHIDRREGLVISQREDEAFKASLAEVSRKKDLIFYPKSDRSRE